MLAEGRLSAAILGYDSFWVLVILIAKIGFSIWIGFALCRLMWIQMGAAADDRAAEIEGAPDEEGAS